MANFVITQSKNGEFRFVLKADNGQVILNSEGYSSKAAALKGLGSVITNSQSKNNFGFSINVIKSTKNKQIQKKHLTNKKNFGKISTYNNKRG